MKLQIGNLTLPNPVLVCPIAGYTNAAFRTILRKFSSSLMFAEMVSVTGLARGSIGSLLRTVRESSHQPLGVQLFGCNPQLFYEGARYAQDQGFDLVDVNFGCPKVPGEELAGSKLLKYPGLIGEIVGAMRKAVTLPLTVKIRAGCDGSTINCSEIGRIAQDQGADGITIHGRTCLQKFSGHCNWEWIKKTVEAVSIPVIANGDIDSPEKADAIMKYTGAKGVMIGRAGLGRPWLLQNISLFLEGKALLAEPGLEEIRALALNHLNLTEKLLGLPYLQRTMRKIVATYFKDVPGVRTLRRQVNDAGSYQEIRSRLESFEALCDTPEKRPQQIVIPLAIKES